MNREQIDDGRAGVGVGVSLAEKRLATILATTIDGIVTISECGIIQTVNPAAERLFGYAADEMVGHNVSMLMPEPYHSSHDGYLAHYRRTGERRIIGIGREVVGRRKDGSTFPMDLAVGEAVSDEGRVFTGIVRDISERKRAERDLDAANRLMESVVAALPVAVILAGDDGTVQLWNPAAERIFGWSAAETVGGILPAGLFGEGEIPLRAADIRCFRKDGSPLDISLSSAPMHSDAGAAGGIIYVMDDVTQRKSLASQLYQAQKMEAVGQLTGGIAHDFNNILGIAIGNLDLLAEETEADPEKTELVEAAQSALLKGADLTRQLLAFSRRQPLQPQRVHLEDRMAASIRMLERTLGEQIEISFRTSRPLWSVAVDVAQLEAAITNLAINARDSMPQGGTLSIELRNSGLDSDYVASNPDAMAGDYVLIEVSDTGAGMTPEILAHAFEPFFTTKPLGKGTGLGLSMVYGFIKQSGGHVKIYSEVGHGTSVKLYLPRADDRMNTGVSDGSVGAIQGGTEMVLVVEDNPDVRRVVARQLHSLGYRLVEAQDAPSALVHLRGAGHFDLLFTDVVMPHGMSGFDLAKEAGMLRPDLKVLFTSGFPGTTMTPPQGVPGGVPLLSKPYRKQDLARAVRAALDGSHLNDG